VRAAAETALRWSALPPDAAATDRLGGALGSAAPEGAVLLLSGPLGAGKTTLAQGVARGCGVEEPVTSPTYNLVLHYRGRRPFTHVDLYRLADEAALATLDLDEILSGAGVTCIEWPALVRPAVLPPFAEIAIEPAPGAAAPEGRRLAGRLVGPGWDAALDALVRAGAVAET
jgi:tRNA threonylcarbamoyladenosine biosynthesis protein TsaE